MGVVLAHQGGLGRDALRRPPLGLFAFLLFIANRKAQAQLDHEADDDAEEDESAGDDR